MERLIVRSKPLNRDLIPTKEIPVETDRITLCEQIYHRNLGFEPFHHTIRVSSLLSGTDQVYQRRYKVGLDWEPLDTGWIKEARYFWVENLGAPRGNLQPTPEEVEEASRQLIEISFRKEPDWVIHPKDSVRLCTPHLSGVEIRAREKPTMILITLIPR